MPAQYEALRRRVEAISRPEPALLAYYVLVAAMTFVAFPFTLLYLLFRYQTLHYRFDAEGISAGHGILFKEEMNLTFAKMQDIHLSRNLVQRWLGIATVTIQTAGAGSSGVMNIEGVKDYLAIRDYLYARMRGVREHLVPGQAPAATHEQPLEARSEVLLAEIRDALNEAAAALRAGASR